MIEQDPADELCDQEYLSKLLKQVKEMFDSHVKQYPLFSDFEQQLKERKVEGIPTDRFAGLDPKIKRHVQVYLAAFFKVVVIICLLIMQLLFLDLGELHQLVHSS